MHQPSDPQAMSSPQIVRELVSDATLLVQRQVQLAKMEAIEALKKEKTFAELIGIGGALAYAGVITLLVAAGLAIGQALGALWLGPLIVGVVLLAAGATVGATSWSNRVRDPLPRTRRELDKEISWAKHELTT